MPFRLSFGLSIFVITAAMAMPAAAQMPGSTGGNTAGGLSGLNLIPEKRVDPEEVEKREQIDKAYRDSLKKQSLQSAPASVDPWSNMRGNDPQPAQPKSAAKKKPANAQ